MFHEYAELQTELSWYKEAQKNQEDPGVLRLALDQSRKDLSKVQGLLNDFTFGFDSIIPQSQYDTLMKKWVPILKVFPCSQCLERNGWLLVPLFVF